MNHEKSPYRNLKIKDLIRLLVILEISVVLLIQLFYYIRFYGIIREREEIYALNTVNQVDEKLQSTADNIKKAATTAAYNSTAQDFLSRDRITDRISNASSLQNLLQSIVDSNPCIQDIAFLDRQSELFTTYQKISYHLLDAFNESCGINAATLRSPVYTQALKDPAGSIWESYYCYLIPVYNMRKVKQRLGTCIVLCSTQYLSDIVSNTSTTPNSVFCIVDSKNQTVVSSRKNIEKEIQSLLSGPSFQTVSKDGRVEASFGGRSSIIRVKTNQNLKWKMVSIIPVQELTSDLVSILQYGIAIWIFIVLLLLFIGIVLNRSITKPISALVNQIGQIGDKNLRQRIVMRRKNEIGLIADNINHMLDKIENLTNRIFKMRNMLYEAEICQKESELSALQSQINPHFLYNTLECIQSIAFANHVMEIVDISSAMGKIFRYSISGGRFSSVRAEIDCIRDYLSIMDIRFRSKFSTSIEVDADLMDRPILKMILQPVVENAVYHGLEPMEDPGKLKIEGRIRGGDIVFAVTDDGVGMDDGRTKELNQLFQKQKSVKGMYLSAGKHLALLNIDSRIKINYGNRYGLRIDSRKDAGTKVTLRLPLQTEKGKETRG